ncbi:hypothetical protein GN316_19385 [Xylophilus sp. Kf1]|nr:hypothetical protein [Xylophilus sp. Kf1]
MKNSYLAHDIPIWIEAYEAVVIETNTIRTTSIKQESELPVYIQGVGSFEEKGAVYSNTTRTQLMWVKHQDGREEELDFSLLEISVRESHKLFIVKTGLSSTKGSVVAVRNLSTEKSAVVHANLALANALGLNAFGNKNKKSLKKIALLCAAPLFLFNSHRLLMGLETAIGTVIFSLFLWGAMMFFSACAYLAYTNAHGWKKSTRAVHQQIKNVFTQLQPSSQGSKA